MEGIKILSGDNGYDIFADMIGLNQLEKAERKKILDQSFMPFKVTDSYAKLIAKTKEPYKTQLINIVLPPKGEKKFIGRFDPYGNRTYRQVDTSFLQHKYDKTLLFHIDDFCISNCQFCYKVNEIRHEKPPIKNLDQKLLLTLDYLEKNPQVDNVLITGGDPAFRKTSELVNVIGKILQSKNVRIVRFATKGLTFEPKRFLDNELLSFFKSANERYGKQVCIIVQINHPSEFSDETTEAIYQLQQAGVQLRGQPAIIRGVNDSVETLTLLQRKFMDHKILSYYLTVFMPVRGVEQYGLPLDEAFENIAASKRQLGGLEKKGILLSSHDFGKFEVCGFYPSIESPQKIILKWHQAVAAKYLPERLKELIPTMPEDLLILDYEKGKMYCIDHVFMKNNLPYFNSDGVLMNTYS